MKQIWLTWMDRLDGLSLRERVFLFWSVLVVCIGLIDTLWLSPAQTAHKQLLVRIDKQGGELVRLRDTLKQSASLPVGGQSMGDNLQQIVKQTADINQAMHQLLPGAEKSAPLAQALVHLLRRHEGLTLVRTTALAPELAGPGNSNVAGSLPAGLSRQGVALTVTGSYAELTRYVMSLEAAMPQVRWGTLNLKVDKGLPELTLQLFLLGEAAP